MKIDSNYFEVIADVVKSAFNKMVAQSENDEKFPTIFGQEMPSFGKIKILITTSVVLL